MRRGADPRVGHADRATDAGETLTSKEQRDGERVAVRAAAAKRQADTERTVRQEQLAEEHRRAAEAVAAKAYEHYLQVREWARQMREVEGAKAPQTAAEEQMIQGLEHLWHATPETIASLRRWCEPISGLRAADHEPGSEESALPIRRELGVLWKQVGRALFVPESPALAGFGYEKRGELYNEDTLRFFTALAALDDAAVLGEFRGTSRRRVVWEIGGGWGGFAYHFKTACPNVTYLITGAPDLFLVSAVYLMTLYPGARCCFYDAAAPDELWRDWQEIDFIFAPESAIGSLRLPRLDLTLDLMALRNMTAARRCAHVQHAFDTGSRYFYSILPTRHLAEGPSTVWIEIERFYWPHPVAPRRDERVLVVSAGEPLSEPSFAHLVGWRRIRV